MNTNPFRSQMTLAEKLEEFNQMNHEPACGAEPPIGMKYEILPSGNAVLVPKDDDEMSIDELMEVTLKKLGHLIQSSQADEEKAIANQLLGKAAAIVDDITDMAADR